MSEINITIKQTNGEKQIFDLSIQSDIAISELKNRIKEVLQIPESKQNLIFKGHILFDNKSLEEYKISDKDTILLVEKISDSNKNNTVPKVNLSTGIGTPGMINYDLLNQPLTGANINPEQLAQILERPEFATQMNNMLSDPDVINAMLNNPQIKPLLDANPMLREQFSNPEFIRSILNPDNLRMMQNMQQGNYMDNNPFMNNMMMNNNLYGGYYNPMMNPFMNPMFPNYNTNNMPQMTNEQLKEKYKEQLSQLKDLGFDNEENNLKALVKSNGNVEAAVGRLVENNF